jgi:hypothetical protein
MGWWRRQETNTRVLLVGLCAVVLVLVAGIVVVAVVIGGGQQQVASSTSSASTTSSSAAPTTVTTAGSAPTAEVTSSTTTATTTTTVAVSSDSIAYAKSLGGTSHDGETLYFVIGASVERERTAQAMLDDATPRFGDMQSYFIVQISDNFEGMEPGWWVIIEAYRSEPSAENLDFGRRGFPDAYVKQATVRTVDPIPVYEDMVGGV